MGLGSLRQSPYPRGVACLVPVACLCPCRSVQPSGALALSSSMRSGVACSSGGGLGVRPSSRRPSSKLDSPSQGEGRVHVHTPARPSTQRQPSLEGSSGGDWGSGTAQVSVQGARQVPRVLLAGRGLSSRTSAAWPEGHRDPGEAAFLWLSTLFLPGDSLSIWGLPPYSAVVCAGPAPCGRPWAATGVPEEWAGWVGQCQECSGAKPELAPSCAPAHPPLLIRGELSS